MRYGPILNGAQNLMLYTHTHTPEWLVFIIHSHICKAITTDTDFEDGSKYVLDRKWKPRKTHCSNLLIRQQQLKIDARRRFSSQTIGRIDSTSIVCEIQWLISLKITVFLINYDFVDPIKATAAQTPLPIELVEWLEIAESHKNATHNGHSVTKS